MTQSTEIRRLQAARDEAFRTAERVWFESQVRFNQWHQSCQEYEKAREALEAAEAALMSAAFDAA
jgi:menaquinone-dependent protoporphyrinogen IX oxidase